MLYFPSTRVAISSELPIAVGATIVAEGQALVADNTGGVFGAKPSAGTSAENFLGIAVSQQLPLLAFPKVEEKVSPITDIITLARTPNAGTVLVFDVTAGAALVVTTDYTLAGKTLTMNASKRGHLIRVLYKFAPTVSEARVIMGDTYPGGATGLTIGQIGIMRSCAIFTTEFNSAVDWSAASPVVKLGANGQFTIGGSGVTVDCAVLQVPNSTSPYLGLLLK